MCQQGKMKVSESYPTYHYKDTRKGVSSSPNHGDLGTKRTGTFQVLYTNDGGIRLSESKGSKKPLLRHCRGQLFSYRGRHE